AAPQAVARSAMQSRTFICLCLLGLFGIFLLPEPRPAAAEPAKTDKPEPVDFNRDVRPILAKNCFACHGPDQGQRASSLRFDQRDSAVKERRRGAAIVPGNPDKSALVARITAADEAERMPPKE